MVSKTVKGANVVFGKGTTKMSREILLSKKLGVLTLSTCKKVSSFIEIPTELKNSSKISLKFKNKASVDRLIAALEDIRKGLKE